jgi:hypothetical protein
MKPERTFSGSKLSGSSYKNDGTSSAVTWYSSAPALTIALTLDKVIRVQLKVTGISPNGILVVCPDVLYGDEHASNMIVVEPTICFRVRA